MLRPKRPPPESRRDRRVDDHDIPLVSLRRISRLGVVLLAVFRIFLPYSTRSTAQEPGAWVRPLILDATLMLSHCFQIMLVASFSSAGIILLFKEKCVGGWY